MKRRGWLPVLLIAAAAALLLFGTRRDLSEPHLRLFSDMVRSPAYKSLYPNPEFRDGRTQQAPPAGTRARDERDVSSTKQPFAPTLENLTRGRAVFETNCSHCHGMKAAGDGAVSKAFPAFSFPINGLATHQLPDATLFHVITYGRNLMPAHRAIVAPEDRWKAILYLRDLQRQELARLGPLAVVPEDPRRLTLVSKDYGKELFEANCAACHGAQGLHPQPGIPTLNSPSVLAIAADAYYWDIINHGRPGTQMPAWKEVLTRTQIESLVSYIRSWATPVPELAKGAAGRGDPAHGGALFATHCAGCHGAQGKGGIGNSLNTPSFLALASDRFLRDTISLGRRHTAMPASYDFGGQDVSDLVAYIRSWAKPAHSFADAQALIPEASTDTGKALFQVRCAGCHGMDGEGGIGSRLHSDGFLSMVDDRFLYNVITEGRPGTAMPAWHFLSAGEDAALIAYLRGWQKSPSVAGSTWTATGRAEFGEVLFKAECVKCHGPRGEGDLGSQIGSPAFLSQVSDDFLRRTISYGKKDTEMKGFLTRARSPLSEDDIGHIIVYLRAMQKNPPAEPLQNTLSWASAKDGQAVYEKKANCAQCHGQHGEGASGPSLGNPAFLQVATNGFLEATVVLGREGTPMKSYFHGGPVHLEQEDIENVVAYVRGFAASEMAATRRVDRSPERAAAGKALYAANCSSCHGLTGLGKHGTKPGEFAPSLNNAEFLKAADDNFLLATIALGRPGTPMPPFALGASGVPALSADEIRALVAYLRTWGKKS